MAKMKTGVYVIECVPANRVYVGSSLRCGQRMADHRSALRKGTHHNKRLQADFDTHGEGAFTFQVVKLCDVKDVNAWETYYIRHYANVYNIHHTAGRRMDEPQRVEAARDRQYARMRSTLTGRKQSPEHKANRQQAIDAARTRGFVKRS